MPRHYLKGFADMREPNCIWMYDKQGGMPQLLPIKKVAQAKRYFTPEVEKALNDEVEKRANPVLDKMRNENSIGRWERTLLSVYMQVMILRVWDRENLLATATPHALEFAFSRVDGLLAAAAARDLSKAPLLAEKRADVRRLKAEWEKELPKDLRRDLLQPRVRPRIAEAIQAMTWIAHVAEGGAAFVTSDNPLFFVRELGLAKSDFFFPISKKVVLWGTHRKDLAERYFGVGPEVVSQTNQLTVLGATRYVFHSTADLPWPYA